ncbi:MarR family winged helix-turn-helix transcriptional regulator [Sphingoaurantiacus capsulatus]|uniref:MarR family winged helix-turn-helix transcriptional regulator n=1 Tax=Sphingoaurantiacus capsulatus TaxID=1771310 RepID=A0ABV7XF28_9SPHN
MRGEPRLFHLLAQAHRAVVQRAERESVAQLGVTPTQLALLYALEGEAGVAMTTVARLLELSPAALSGLADRCEAAGLVTRRPSASDGRAIELVATPHGRDLREKSYPLLSDLNARLVEGLDTTEQVAAAKFLTGLIDRFGKSRGD